MSLVIYLAALPADRVRGIYTIAGVPGRMPARALFLHPDAAASYLADLADVVVVSDMFRSPESSLEAVRSGRGARPPGYSGHNYGLSADIDIGATRRRLGLRTKAALDLWLERRGWWCHRRDHEMSHEAWHYNFLGAGAVIAPRFRSTSGYLEARIVELYGDQLRLDARGVQVALQRLGLYHGEIDGDVGPLTRAAIRVFRRGWGLGASEALDARFQRTLAYVACERRVVPAADADSAAA